MSRVAKKIEFFEDRSLDLQQEESDLDLNPDFLYLVNMVKKALYQLEVGELQLYGGTIYHLNHYCS